MPTRRRPPPTPALDAMSGAEHARILVELLTSVVAYAGPDSVSELADEVMNEANKLGVVLTPEIADQFWPDWSLPA